MTINQKSQNNHAELSGIMISDLYKEHMKKIYKSLWLKTSFAFAILVLFFISILTYTHYQEMLKNNQLYSNVIQIILKIDESLSLLHQVKNNQSKLNDSLNKEIFNLVDFSYDTTYKNTSFLVNHMNIKEYPNLNNPLVELKSIQRDQKALISRLKQIFEEMDDISKLSSTQRNDIVMLNNRILEFNNKMQMIFLDLANQSRYILTSNQKHHNEEIEQFWKINLVLLSISILLFCIGYFIIRYQINKSYKMASNLIQFREEQLLLLNTMPMGLFRCQMIDERFRPSWGSDQVQKITGFTPEAFVDDPYLWETRIHPQDKERILNDYRSIFKSQKVEHEYRWLTANGEYRWFLEHMILLNQNGELYLIGLWLDINHRKYVEEQIREKTTVMENAVEGIAKVDLEGDYIQVNPSYGLLLGFHVNDLIGTHWTRFVRQDDHKELMNHYRLMIQTGKSECELRSICIDGKEIYTQIVMVKALDSDGKMTGHYCFMRDISQRKHTELELKRANEQLMNNVSQLEQRNQEVTILSEMGELLQTCQSSSEAYPIIKHIVKRLFPKSSGGIYILTDSKNLFENVVCWGDFLHSESVFQPEDCWSLRRSHLHQVIDVSNDLICKHVDHHIQYPYMCVPLTSHGEIMGILHIEFKQPPQNLIELDNGHDSEHDLHHHIHYTHQNIAEPNVQRLIITIAEQLSLALSNLKLRETLQNQSIRDPLTGLFNRRYMEESLEREISRVRRKKSQLGIMMLDVDHFKRLNDTYGHDAGDIILRGLGAYLKQSIRKEDIACRYGGEEFLLILPEISKEQLLEKAWILNQNISTIVQFTHRPDLPNITISVGVALYPTHAEDIRLLINLADMALYRAKQAGRNRVEEAQLNSENSN